MSCAALDIFFGPLNFFFFKTFSRYLYPYPYTPTTPTTPSSAPTSPRIGEKKLNTGIHILARSCSSRTSGSSSGGNVFLLGAELGLEGGKHVCKSGRCRLLVVVFVVFAVCAFVRLWVFVWWFVVCSLV